LAAAERGQTERDEGRYRAARESCLACARDVCPKLVTSACTKWLREAEDDAPTVVLGAKSERGDDLTDVRVSFDGAPFASLLDGRPLEADAGEHIFRFGRDGSLSIDKRLVLRAGEKARVVTVTFAPTDAAGAPGPPGTATPHETGAWTPERSLVSPRNAALAGLGLGALAAAGGGAFMAVRSGQDASRATSLRDGRSANACTDAPTTPTCEALTTDVGSQRREMTTATWLFAGAGALATGAALLWLLWPERPPSSAEPTVSVQADLGGATVHVAGRFR
jgi:hypothetical protein